MDLEAQVKLLQPPKSTEADYLERYNATITFVVQKVKSEASLYTNIPFAELPESLNPSMVMMASNLIESYRLTHDADAIENEDIKQLSEGDTTIAYADSQDRLSKAMESTGLTNNYRAALNKVRRVVF